MTRRASYRASDADRDRVAERLRQAAAEGRLLAHELEERLGTALRARTYGELDAVIADLPAGSSSRRTRRSSRSWQLARTHPVATVTLLVAVTLVAFVTAAIVLAGLFAFSGVWLMLAFVLLARRAGWYGPPRRQPGPYGRYPGPYGRYGTRRSRRAHGVP